MYWKEAENSMENTRQILKVKFNKNINEVNEIINSYLKASKFIEIDYNSEKVLKHNSFMTKLDFFKTRTMMIDY